MRRGANLTEPVGDIRILHGFSFPNQISKPCQLNAAPNDSTLCSVFVAYNIIISIIIRIKLKYNK